MKLLPDTPVSLWWLVDEPRLSERVAALIADRRNEVLVSAVSYYEIAYKAVRGRLSANLTAIGATVRDYGFQPLAISCEHAAHAGSLPWEHRDPWDRLLAAQTQLEECSLVSADPAFDSLGLARRW